MSAFWIEILPVATSIMRVGLGQITTAVTQRPRGS
jgi:hypothetical protein